MKQVELIDVRDIGQGFFSEIFWKRIEILVEGWPTERVPWAEVYKSFGRGFRFKRKQTRAIIYLLRELKYPMDLNPKGVLIETGYRRVDEEGY
ncbi:hypothetical protein KAW38_00415 [Candidatus Micrarchaeota archaeon]|nr:hypothetical protein [Candidatus Micrarchaeota archaeon]